MSDSHVFPLTGVILAGMATSLFLLDSLGIIDADPAGVTFMLCGAILFSVWGLEERVKELELKRQ